MVMPAGMSGRDLAEQLRLARPDLRVLYSSGYSQELQDVGRLSIDALLPKPYDPRALLQAVRRRLDAQ
jgi:CheY-like chemotaxis protein